MDNSRKNEKKTRYEGENFIIVFGSRGIRIIWNTTLLCKHAPYALAPLF